MRQEQKTAFARHLRRNSTDAERALWQRLRTRQLRGWKFRRQVPIGPYIVDFACLEARVIIELDGGHHAGQAERDAARSAHLEQGGFRVLRFWNDQVLTSLGAVLEAIADACSSPHPGPLPQAGEGEQQRRMEEQPPCC
ncbi:MAG: endonuclease domain-containing protein [Pseudomonadota bacterium]